jgi:hypothetical protein
MPVEHALLVVLVEVLEDDLAHRLDSRPAVGGKRLEILLVGGGLAPCDLPYRARPAAAALGRDALMGRSAL